MDVKNAFLKFANDGRLVTAPCYDSRGRFEIQRMTLSLKNAVQLTMIKAGLISSATNIQWGDEVFLREMDLTKLTRSHLMRHLKARKADTLGSRKVLFKRLKQSLEDEREKNRVISEALENEHRRIANLEEQGAVYCVGSNHKGQLGLGDLEHKTQFTVIPESRGLQLKEVRTRNDIVFAVTQEHQVFCWGGSGVGPSGFSSSKSRLRFEFPQLVEALEEEDIVHVSIGANHACALNKHGNIYSWGEGRNGCLGNDSLTNCEAPDLVPVFIGDENIECIDSGEMHTCALSVDRCTCYSWGHPQNGRLGVGQSSVLKEGGKCAIHCSPFMIKFPSNKKIKLLSCGAEHTVAVSTNEVLSWGCNDGGRLGHGDFEDRWEPCIIDTLTGLNVSGISCGTWHSACIVILPPMKEYGWLYTFGSGFNGQLGQGAVTSSPFPNIVPFFCTNHILLKQVTCGSHHNAVLTMDNELYTWGSNLNCCLGRDVQDDFTNFTSLPGHCVGFGSIVDRIGRGHPISIACGRGFTIVCTSAYQGPSEGEAVGMKSAQEKEDAKKKREELTKSTRISNLKTKKSEYLRHVEERKTQVQLLTSKRGCTLCDCPGEFHYTCYLKQVWYVSLTPSFRISNSFQ